jgi:hypothetical protein
MRRKAHHAARQTACHESKVNKEDEVCAPHRARVAKSIFPAHAVFIDQVDDEDAERVEARDPVYEGDVHGYRVIWLIVWWVRVGGEDGGSSAWGFRTRR